MSDTGHCWHDSGPVFTSNPPQSKETCCWCGETRMKSAELVDSWGHGPHAPPILREPPWWNVVDEHVPPPEPDCPKRPAPEPLKSWDLEISCPRCGEPIAVNVRETHVFRSGRQLEHAYTPTCCESLTEKEQQAIIRQIFDQIGIMWVDS